MSQNKIWNAEDYVVEPTKAAHMLRDKLNEFKSISNEVLEIIKGTVLPPDKKLVEIDFITNVMKTYKVPVEEEIESMYGREFIVRKDLDRELMHLELKIDVMKQNKDLYNQYNH